jgi:enoyl-CoA hydratase
MAYEFITVEKDGSVAIIKLNRPQALNALCNQLTEELAEALQGFESDDHINCVVLTGSEKAFAAGADIKELMGKDGIELFENDPFSQTWEAVARFRKPIIAAVSGYALGGGCEIAMMCDFIIAADNAKFGQPEITLGVMPGAGGTQRLPRYTSKSMAMYMCLTGQTIDAETALRAGLVARVVPLDDLMEVTVEAAKKVAAMSRPIAMMTKETINQAYETTLSQGVLYERRVFQSMFATHDQKEGMAAFAEKRTPHFRNK